MLELRFATYDNEYVRVTPGQPFLVTLDGRLDCVRVRARRAGVESDSLAAACRVQQSAMRPTPEFAKLLALCDTSPDSSQGRHCGDASTLPRASQLQDLPRDAPVYRRYWNRRSMRWVTASR